MDGKDLKKLNRQELLELLLSQSKKLDRLQNRLAETEQKLKEKEIAISESGSIAEAAVRLTGFFDAAQKAADVYIEQCRLACEKTEQDRERILSDARLQAGEIIEYAEKYGAMLPERDPDKEAVENIIRGFEVREPDDESVSLSEENTVESGVSKYARHLKKKFPFFRKTIDG